MWEYNHSDELYHYGVLGMKWGVHRYQNYDGSYTKKGMLKYNESMEAYNKANDRYKTIKKNKGSKADTTNARVARQKAERKLKKDYKHLKQDKLGDKGKVLYSKGYRMRGVRKVEKALADIGGLSIAASYGAYKLGYPTATNALFAIGGASIVASGATSTVRMVNNRKLRAYYNHSSNY